MLIFANFLGYQLTWFITVAGAGRGLPWVGVAATSLFSAIQLAVSDQRALDVRLLSMALLFGVLCDGGLARLQLVDFSAATPAIPTGGAPLWILTLWMAFSLTLNRSLRWLQRRPLTAAIFGAIGAPLAYTAAGMEWNSLEFLAPRWRGELWLALSWALAMYLFARVVTVHLGRAAPASRTENIDRLSRTATRMGRSDL